MLDGIKKAGDWSYTAVLKSFRGLICEKKDGGWELSQGRVMAWVVFYQLVKTASGAEEAAGIEWLFYAWMGAMAYCGYTKTDLGGTISKIRAKA